ncbi:hypothetical protein FB446DRAFT_700139 [Lentinula raphanica]|nr:hypothetical protein FB446DRAFT_700139 [Lentinula raphanica]
MPICMYNNGMSKLWIVNKVQLVATQEQECGVAILINFLEKNTLSPESLETPPKAQASQASQILKDFQRFSKQLSYPDLLFTKGLVVLINYIKGSSLFHKM